MSIFREDPYPAYNFLIELPVIEADAGSVLAGFSEVSGLEIEQQMIRYRNGNDRRLTPRQVPGLVSYAPLVLKRGITGSNALWQWMAACNDGDCEPSNGVVSLLDEQRIVVMQWDIVGALPQRLSGPTLNANASGIAIERLELSHTGLSLRN